MDDGLLLASRLLLLGTGVGGSAAIAVSLIRRRARREWLPGAVAVVLLLQFGATWGEPAPAPIWLVTLMLVPYFVGFALLAATFPDGRFVPRWSAWFVIASAVVLLGNAVSGDTVRDSPWWTFFAGGQLVLAVGFLVVRYRRSATTRERESLRWILLGTIVTVAAFMLIAVAEGNIADGGALSEAKANLAGIPLMLGVIVGLAWPRLWNVDAVFRAVLVVLGAGWMLGGIHAAATALAAWMGAPAATVGVVAVAVAAYPVIRGAMRLANAIVYRDRVGPDAAAARLAAALDAEDARPVAQRITETAAEATASPRVDLEAAVVADAGVFTASTVALMAGGSGRPDRYSPESDSVPERFAVSFRSELLAVLIVRPRAGESELSRRDRAALRRIAQHAAPALDGARALTEARTAQSSLVGAREEERRRLRRDLHDDLGPALAGIALGVAALARRADAIDSALAESARDLQGDIVDAVARSREISHDLRPAILDDVGLEAAIRDRLGNGDDLDVTVDDLGALPAAVDLAALRIVQEAVTNVRRHAQASRCQVDIRRDASGLRIDVSDDGVGMPRTVAPGLGLRSIRGRAAELGGRARIDRAGRGGTRVSVWLPIADPPQDREVQS